MKKRTIIHVDGDAFFAACEVALNPKLKGKPVVTGQERGIASALTYEAKGRGIVRGMPIWQVRKICPDVIVLPGDYETYSIFSERMYAIVRRYTNKVEEYGIDECFADITSLDEVYGISSAEVAHRIKSELWRDLGMTFSVGVGPNKLLAKVGSKWQKPDGFTVIDEKNRTSYLEELSVEKIWGIGRSTSYYLGKKGVRTAADFLRKGLVWTEENFSRPIQEIFLELEGYFINELDTDTKTSYHTISKTRTFTPPESSPEFLLSQLSKNTENACIKARRYGLVTKKIFFFIKNQDFYYKGKEVELPERTSSPSEIMKVIEKNFSGIYVKDVYRSTGVTLMSLSPEEIEQQSLFFNSSKVPAFKKIYHEIDKLSEKYGKYSVYLGSSMKALVSTQHQGERSRIPYRKERSFKGETQRKRLYIPYMGEAY